MAAVSRQVKWVTARLGDVATISSGITLGRDPRGRDWRMVPYLRVANVKDGWLDLSEVKQTPASEDEIRDCRLDPGDILLTEGGDPDKLGRGTFWEGQIPECIHQNHIFRVRSDPGRFDPAFLGHQFGSPYGKAYFLRHAKQTTGIACINKTVLSNFPLLIPPLPEQRHIAARLREQLAEVTKARAAVQSQFDAAHTLPAAHLRAIFSGDALTKWPTRVLADVAEISGGVTLGRDLRGRPARPVPYLRVANVKDGHLDLAHVKEVEATEDEIDACRLQFGDLLLTEGGDPDKLGRGTYWQEQLPECIHQNHIFRVRFDLAAFDPAFVASQIGSPYGKAYFLAHAKQTTGIATINRTVLSKYPLLAPPVSEQRAVAARLDIEQKAARDLTAHLKEKLIAVDNLPAALLREAFSGRL